MNLQFSLQARDDEQHLCMVFEALQGRPISGNLPAPGCLLAAGPPAPGPLAHLPFLLTILGHLPSPID